MDYSTVFVFRFSSAIMRTLFLARPEIYYNSNKEIQPTCLNETGEIPTSTTKSQLKDALQDVLENSKNCLSRSKRDWDSHIAFKDGNSANTFAKQLIEIAKIKVTLESYFPIRFHLEYIIESITRKFKA